MRLLGKIIETGYAVPRGYKGVVKINETAYPSTYCGYYGTIYGCSFKREADSFVFINVYRTYEDAVSGNNLEVLAQVEESCLSPVTHVRKKNNYW